MKSSQRTGMKKTKCLRVFLKIFQLLEKTEILVIASKMKDEKKMN